MCTEFCIFCGAKENLENHHVLPKSEGGTDEDFNLVTCCSLCHGKLHDLKRKPNHGELVKQGLQRAKERGVKLGNPQNLTYEARGKALLYINKKKADKAQQFKEEMLPIILAKKLEGKTLMQIAEELNRDNYKRPSGRIGGWDATTVRRILL